MRDERLHDSHTDSIAPEYGVISEERKRLDNTLRDQKTVERISMNGWKAGDAGRVCRCYRQLDQAHLRQSDQQPGEVDAKISASERALDRDFPDARCAVIYVVFFVFYELAGFMWQSLAVRRRPKEQVRVEQEPHRLRPSKVRITESGSGELKSSGI